MAKRKLQPKKQTKRPISESLIRAALCAAIAAITALIYWQVRTHDFVRFDDFTYIRSNPHVLQGPTAESLRWAFNIGYAANWHPLTWISHMIDVRLFGVDAGKHHLMGLGIHILSSILLFIVLARMTGSTWRAAFVAVLFAIHPLHVESVAWAAERKDVLSTFFMMLTLLAYVHYTKKPGVGRYLIAILMFALGLLAKPMLVSLPFLLLLLDYWPLRRTDWRRLVMEKLPFLALAIGSSVLTYMAQNSLGAVQDFEHFSLPIRLENAALSYVIYMRKMFWPTGMGIPYPHPGKDISLLWAGLSAVLLAGISYLVTRPSRFRPYAVVGWLWYLVTLIPVIGLMQVGGQAMADRYTYIPLIGLFIIIAWAVPDLLDRPEFPARARMFLAIPAIAVTLILSLITVQQVSYWQDTVTVFKHTISVTDKNVGAYNNLGAELLDHGRVDEAMGYLSKAVEYDPKYGQGRWNLGNAYVEAGRLPEAIEQYEAAVKLEPKSSDGRASYGRALTMSGRADEGIDECQLALRLNPNNPDAHNNLGMGYAAKNRLADADAEFTRALQLNPTMAEAEQNLGYSFALQGRFAEAVPHYERSLALKPDFAQARMHLAQALYQERDYQGALNQLQTMESLGERPDAAFVTEVQRKISEPTR